MNKCKEYEELLTERNLPENVKDHLASCERCSSLRKEWLQMQEAMRAIETPDIPAQIDSAIRNAARKQSYTRSFRYRFRQNAGLWLSAAACLAVTMGLMIHPDTPKVKSSLPMVTAKVTSDWSSSGFAADVAAFSLELDQTALALSFSDNDINENNFETAFADYTASL